MIGLYSERARQTHVAAQQFVSERGGPGPVTPERVRAARRDILALPPDHPVYGITQRSDFFTLSECRDLIFHVQEHRFTLPQIADALAELALEFIGFAFRDSVWLERYRTRFPKDPAAISLANWHRFETERPETFLGMYHFWVRATG